VPTVDNVILLKYVMNSSGSQQATGIIPRSLQLVPQLTASAVQLVASSVS